MAEQLVGRGHIALIFGLISGLYVGLKRGLLEPSCPDEYEHSVI